MQDLGIIVHCGQDLNFNHLQPLGGGHSVLSNVVAVALRTCKKVSIWLHEEDRTTEQVIREIFPKEIGSTDSYAAGPGKRIEFRCLKDSDLRGQIYSSWARENRPSNVLVFSHYGVFPSIEDIRTSEYCCTPSDSVPVRSTFSGLGYFSIPEQSYQESPIGDPEDFRAYITTPLKISSAIVSTLFRVTTVAMTDSVTDFTELCNLAELKPYTANTNWFWTENRIPEFWSKKCK